MIDVIYLDSEEGRALRSRVTARSSADYSRYQGVVDDILQDVKKNGDKALYKYALWFDGAKLNERNIRVTDKEIKAAYKTVDKDLLAVIRRAAARIAAYHEKQKRNSWLEPSANGEMLGQIIRPIQTAGVYVPGGKAAYPSSVLMNVIPARIAGVSRIVMTTPVKANLAIEPAVLVAAVEGGVTDIFKVGGAQAVAAMAFGTKAVPRVDKIVGPGNIYVALAKRSVFGFVGIDSVAGPSEVLIIADETANPVYLAADLMAQAEHDELASAILVTTSEELANNVKAELARQIETLERKDIIQKSLNSFGAVVVVNDLAEAAAFGNETAPEHMEIITKDPFALLGQIENAGSIFLGGHSPEPLGDYMAGPNHVLPTGGTARFFSGLGVDDFIKKSSVVSFSKGALAELKDDIIRFANAEGLTAHANAVRVRFDE